MFYDLSFALFAEPVIGPLGYVVGYLWDIK